MTGQKKNTGIFESVTSHIYIVDMKNTTKRRRRYLNKLRKRSAFCMLLLALIAIAGMTLEIVRCAKSALLRNRSMRSKKIRCF